MEFVYIKTIVKSIFFNIMKYTFRRKKKSVDNVPYDKEAAKKDKDSAKKEKKKKSAAETKKQRSVTKVDRGLPEELFDIAEPMIRESNLTTEILAYLVKYQVCMPRLDYTLIHPLAH